MKDLTQRENQRGMVYIEHHNVQDAIAMFGIHLKNEENSEGVILYVISVGNRNWRFYHDVIKDPSKDRYYLKSKPDLIIDFADIYKPSPEELNEKLNFDVVYRAIEIADEYFQKYEGIPDLELWYLGNKSSYFPIKTRHEWLLTYLCKKNNLPMFIHLRVSVSKNKVFRASVDIYDEDHEFPIRQDLNIKKHLID